MDTINKKEDLKVCPFEVGQMSSAEAKLEVAGQYTQRVDDSTDGYRTESIWVLKMWSQP